MKQPLKYGCNPHQQTASITSPEEADFRVLNGQPSYINLLDALGAWQLARELKAATGKASAASFKHTSPAGAAVEGVMSKQYLRSQFLPLKEVSDVCSAYSRARGGDRMCSFGDVAAISDEVDMALATMLKSEVSDLLIAPAYGPETLELLRQKKKGNYLLFQINPDYEPAGVEKRQIFGFEMEQERNTASIDRDLFDTDVRGVSIPEDIKETLVVATIALKYTQSNSVCVAYEGQVIGVGAGQQSRVHCTRLACDKADKWMLQQHPKTLSLDFIEGLSKADKANVVDQYLRLREPSNNELSEKEYAHWASMLNTLPEPISSDERREWINQFKGLCLSSDAYIPFRDNLDRASQSNIQYVAHTGGSVRDSEVTEAAREYGMRLISTGLRLFLH